MRFDRAVSLARYNWPLYLVCLVSATIGFATTSLASIPIPIRFAAAIIASIAIWYAIASFLAFHVMFDRSGFLSGRWLSQCISGLPRTCVQLSVCVEETTLPIQRIFPQSKCINLDLYDQSIMTEPAIARAKQTTEPSSSITAKPDALPVDEDSSDLTIVTLAAHEIRDIALRASLFNELARITK